MGLGIELLSPHLNRHSNLFDAMAPIQLFYYPGLSHFILASIWFARTIFLTLLINLMHVFTSSILLNTDCMVLILKLRLADERLI